MDKTEFFPELFRHIYWADAKTWKRLLKLPNLDKEDELKKLMYHIHLVQYAFLKLWHDEPMDFPKPDSFETIGEISKWGHEYHKNMAIFLEKFDNSDINREIIVPWSEQLEKKLGHKIINASLGETMLQVFSHTTYHRGQANKMIRELGGEPPLVDYIAWVWYSKPDAMWPSL